MGCQTIIKSGLLGLGLMFAGSMFASEYSLMSDVELDERIQYLEQDIDEISSSYAYWQYGWSGLYSVSAISNFATALDEDDHDDEVLAWVSALKASAALSKMLLAPVPLLDVDDAYEYEEEETDLTLREQKESRLTQLEDKLVSSAIRSDERYQWQTHATSIGVNLVAGAMIATWGDSDDALESVAVGIGMGQLAIWTQPTKATQAWQSYQEHFDDAKAETITWHLQPRLNGLDLVVNF